MKHAIALLSALLLLLLLPPPLATLHAADLGVVNGDFSDLSGLTPWGGHGWYQGVPAGWKASSKTPFYSVHTGADGKQPACNVSQLGVLEQNVGEGDGGLFSPRPLFPHRDIWWEEPSGNHWPSRLRGACPAEHSWRCTSYRPRIG